MTKNVSNSIHQLKKVATLCKWSASPVAIRAAKSRTTIELTKKEGSPLGLTISGGVDKEGKPRVAQLKHGSVAQKCDVLEIGDVILSVNGIKTAGLKHDQVIELIKQVGDQLTLEIEYDLPLWPIHSVNTVHTKTIQIQLEKEGHSYGFTLRGGLCDDKCKTRPLIVTKIRPSGPADRKVFNYEFADRMAYQALISSYNNICYREGTIKIGDRVLAINGISVASATLQDAHNLMKQCRGTTLFLIEYDVAVVDSVKHATGPLLIEIEKSPGSTIGISLAQKWVRGRSIIVVDTVKPASIADRCGALRCGDHINAIDQKSFDNVTINDANNVLRSCTGEFCRIELTPSSFTRSPDPLHRVSINDNTTFQRAPSSNSMGNWTMRNSFQNIARKSTKARHNSISSLNSCYQSIIGNQVCHAETMDVLLRIDENGGSNFGFTLQGASFTSDTLMQPPVIGYLEPNGVAEKSGVLQPGDRVLVVNGQQLEGLTLEDARRVIKETNQQIHLEIEFDVADSVMLSSGTCQVKILRKTLDLGLSVTYPRSNRPDEPPLISDVKKGSIAYRCGMIQPGDRLLSIDHHTLRGKSLTEIIHLLKNCDEIVRLKIKKDDVYSEDNLNENVVVYKVQLLRQGGPLGLTISGSEDVFEPIIVSGLCEGGLADKTNAIHIGDRILAINDVTLRGKGLNEAIKLLQASGDEITLKISRSLDSQIQKLRNFNNEDYTPSVDSAMESWDGSNTEHRLSDNSDHKENDSSNNQNHINGNDSILPRSDFVLKHGHHLTLARPSGYRTPPTNGRPLETIRHSDSGDSIHVAERELSRVLNDLDVCTVISRQAKSTDHNQRTYSHRSTNGNNNHHYYNNNDRKYDNCDENDHNLAYYNQFNNSNRNRPMITNGGQNTNGDNTDFAVNTLLHSTTPNNLPNEVTNRNINNNNSTHNNPNSYVYQHIRCDLLTVILKRDKRILDFGFSISDRLYGTGVYINKIRANGPAEFEGTLRPCMRIYKVNSVDVTRMECNQVVPLLSNSHDELQLIVSRTPAPMFDETDEYDLLSSDLEEETPTKTVATILQNEHENENRNNNNNNDAPSPDSTWKNNFTLLSQAKTSTV
ncbi:unnamed protein product [Didymodactylos carnosus]|uniref:PDZ domain-containing protein n=1 Tax=Didymodactylos carnosus TaxID=1234261 RepID=A0A813W0G4_9BILA|nr:unnamed protein product [Didymodactylos carnosus]CAF0886652.1 unnamed protein product [Didymodactylos carnosus]CAF3638313.1 unnamed protein product [Didymodactylos carnosus]CAF3669592.1 unnamed protein product [Didymodactylos carnosus]